MNACVCVRVRVCRAQVYAAATSGAVVCDHVQRHAEEPAGVCVGVCVYLCVDMVCVGVLGRKQGVRVGMCV